MADAVDLGSAVLVTWRFDPSLAYNIMTEHRLKTQPDDFHAMWEGRKRFELRQDDGFQVDDVLLLHEWDGTLRAKYTGAWIRARVMFVLRAGAGLEPGHVVMSLAFTGKGQAMCMRYEGA